MTLPLSPLTQQIVETLFEPADRTEATRRLVEECGNNIPFCNDYDEYQMERIRFAALRISIGYLHDLQTAIDLAKSDWRDLLVWARFAESLTAHQEWSAQVIKGYDMPMAIILIGLPGSGKTTVGNWLAHNLGWMFYEIDNFHTTKNFTKFMQGQPIDDEDMSTWLAKAQELVEKYITKKQSVIFSCSALKESYRQSLHINDKVYFVYLRGTYAQLEERQKNRKHILPHVERLAYQYSIFEEPHNVWAIDVNPPAQEIADAICKELEI
ncbi:MAG: shikimate kinase [Anaerolineales bacterium]